MIRFDSVTKRYPDGTVAVHELSLDAPSHQITVLVGPSGCGKTTSLRMINRMIDPTEGRIWLDDKDISTVPPPQLRRGMGYVIQAAGLFPHRTVVDNVATVPFLLKQNRRDARAKAMQLLERVGLPAQLAKRYPAQLSGGQQQRVGVARALAADPQVMLMDEPFSAVDPVVRAQLQDEFLRLQADLAKTIVFVTHDIDEAIKLGDHVAVLRVGGRLTRSSPDSSDATGATALSGSPSPTRCHCITKVRSRSGPTWPTRPGRPATAGCSSSTPTSSPRAGWPSRAYREAPSPARSPPTCSTSAAPWP